MSNTDKFDVIVIGGGPGGYVAAIRASQLGQKVALIEREQLGGVCLNWGCIPTKALLRSAELYRQIQDAARFGINVQNISFDLNTIIDRSKKVSSGLVAGIRSLLNKNKISLIQGEAKLLGGGKAMVNNQIIAASKIIIATGARAKILDGFEPNGSNIWTYKEALSPKSIPESMVIVGSGAIGVEFASFYSSFGTKVTIIEHSARILRCEDEEISAMAAKIFEERGIKLLTSSTVKSHASLDGGKLKLIINHDQKEISLETDILLMAVGIKANTENIGLENTKISLSDNGHIQTNEYMQTSDGDIYAIGDVVAGPWLAHKASHEGIIAAEMIATGKSHKMHRLNIPACTYSIPQIASLGLTEEKALEQGYKTRIGRFPLYANGKALAIGDSHGLVKTIFDDNTGELLGAHMIGPDVTELIQGYVVAKQLETTEEDLIATIFAHPTISESMHESVLSAYQRAIHI